ncbi:MAG: DUF1573 domain-containing protein [Bacteroidia bacterium]|nr:MAG: DUF1573 domain-containing protein [Bacteroidia bacterium]
MNTILIFILISGLSLFSAEKQREDQSFWRYSQPYIVIDQAVKDMGIMEQGARGNGEIRLRNDGAREFLIGSVRSACGLMIPSWPPEPVAPGEEVILRFRYDTSRLGPFERKVVIHTNAYQKTVVITVKGEVIPAAKSDD